jgi:hypothetical protein
MSVRRRVTTGQLGNQFHRSLESRFAKPFDTWAVPETSPHRFAPRTTGEVESLINAAATNAATVFGDHVLGWTPRAGSTRT